METITIYRCARCGLERATRPSRCGCGAHFDDADPDERKIEICEMDFGRGSVPVIELVELTPTSVWS
jgi:DNA-directed RNA polymerase subunit RPC12/RpoP